MRIEKAGKKDFPEIEKMIEKDFPYVQRSTENALEKMKRNEITFFKAVEGKKIIGFVEVETFQENIARINGLSVNPNFRRKGIGKKLLLHVIAELEKRGIERVVLLVKQSNQKAKELYESVGFNFIGLYHRRIDEAVVEEMELSLVKEKPCYVS